VLNGKNGKMFSRMECRSMSRVLQMVSQERKETPTERTASLKPRFVESPLGVSSVWNYKSDSICSSVE
jgi:hypothetical protein